MQCYLGFLQRLNAVRYPYLWTISCRTGHSSICNSQCVQSVSRKNHSTSSDILSDSQIVQKLYTDISKGGLWQDKSLIINVTHEVTNMLSRVTLPNKYTSQAITNLIFLLGSLPYFYDQDFYDSVSVALLTSNEEDLFLHVLPCFLWSCSKRQHYPQPLLERAGQFIIDNLAKFNDRDLSMIVTAYSRLNHHLPQLISKVEKHLLSSGDVQTGRHLSWTLAWAGVVFKDHPKELLTIILNDEYIQGCTNTITEFELLVLFQLKICLNKECPELDLGMGWDSSDCVKKFGVCRSGIKGISDQTMQTAYKQKVDSYCTMKRTLFNSNLHRAIRTALNDRKLVQSDGLSLCGYVFDFEVFLDKNGEPIPIPIKWKYRSPQVVCASVGVEGRRSRSLPITFSDELVESMRSVEVDRDSVRNSDVLASNPDLKYEVKDARTNLSDDWGSKFQSLSRKCARKLVIEGEGPHHTARNCSSHILGNTVVKRRQVEALGWELLTVDYKVWRELETGHTQAKYMYSLIFGD